MIDTTKVFFIGDVALDEYYSAPYFPRIKEKVLVQTLNSQMGGMIANAACVYASFGRYASFLAALNPGAVSLQLRDGLQEAGLDAAYIVWDNSLPDSKTIIILAENEHTVFIPTLNLQKIELPKATLDAICASNYLYSTFCELRPLHHRDLDSVGILGKAKANGCRLWCDLDVADIRDADECFFEYVDTLFVNEIGFQNLAKRTLDGDVSGWLFSKGLTLLVITRAENGCTVFECGKEEYSISGIKVPVVDVTGAGDTFCSSFMYAHTRTSDIHLCAEFANYAAARAVTYMGPRAGASGVDAVLNFIYASGGNPDRFSILI